jgi:hypothetical protein
LFGSTLDSGLIYNKSIIFHKYIYPNCGLDYDLLSTLDAIYFCSATGVQSNVKVAEDLIYGLNTFEPIINCEVYSVI